MYVQCITVQYQAFRTDLCMSPTSISETMLLSLYGELYVCSCSVQSMQ